MGERYVVVVERKALFREDVYGVYHSFRTASLDAMAWNGIDGCLAYVKPIQSPDNFKKGSEP